MTRIRRLAVLAILSLALSSLASAKTRRYSVIVNRPQVRDHITQKLFDGKALRLGRTLDPKNLANGITAQAAKKAVETWNGFRNLNYGVTGGNYVVSARRNGQHWVITDARDRSGLGVSPSPNPVEHFVARTGLRGIVVARGYAQGGRITWTRSQNERGKNSPSERNGAGR